MIDYTWPSVLFSYFTIGVCVAVALFFFVRSLRDGYWGKNSEQIKYSVFEEPESGAARGGRD